MAKKRRDPGRRWIKVPAGSDEPRVFTHEKLPPKPERDRIIRAVELRLLRERGYLD